MIQMVVHEPTSLWTAELERRFLCHPKISIRWHPHRDELLKNSNPADLAVLVVEPDDASLELIQVLKTRRETTRIVCLLREMSESWEWLARELGADVVLSDVVEKRRLAHSVQRLFSQEEIIATK